MGLRLKLAFPSAELLRSPRAKRILERWSRAHDLHNAGCEVRFARNKTAVSRQAKPQYMVAKSVVSDAVWAMHGDVVVQKGVLLDDDGDGDSDDDVAEQDRAQADVENVGGLPAPRAAG